MLGNAGLLLLLRDALKGAGLLGVRGTASKASLSRLIGVDRSTIWKWYKGKIYPRKKNLNVLSALAEYWAEYLEITKKVKKELDNLK